MTTPAALSPQEIADLIGMSRRQVYRWIKREELPTRQIDGQHRITESMLAGKVGEEMAREVFQRAGERRSGEEDG